MFSAFGVWCDNPSCEFEATHFAVHKEGDPPHRAVPLCYACKVAYEWGQASPGTQLILVEKDNFTVDEEEETFTVN